MECSRLRIPGSSDKFFYYTASGTGMTMDLRVEIHFREAVDFDLLQSAFGTALSFFPEFAFRPVIKDGKIYYEENHASVSIHDDVNERINYATEDTNGLNFFLSRSKEDPFVATVSFYHALTDWAGFMRFLRTALAVYTGVETTEAGARISAPGPEVWNTEENLDPYNKFGNKDMVSDYTPELGDFFYFPQKQYEPGAGKAHIFRLRLSVSEFLKRTRELHTSFTPYFTCIVSGVMNELYDIGNRPFLMSLPVNLRPVFNTDCIANFSDAAFVSLSPDERLLPVEEQCRLMRSQLELQRKPEFFARMLYDKVQTLREFECDPCGVVVKSRELTKDGFIPFASYVTSYFGILDMPESVNEKIDHIYVNAPFGTSCFMLTTYGDVLTVTSSQCFDEDILIRALCDRFIELGFNASFEDRGTVIQNTMDLSKLKIGY